MRTLFTLKLILLIPIVHSLNTLLSTLSALARLKILYLIQTSFLSYFLAQGYAEIEKRKRRMGLKLFYFTEIPNTVIPYKIGNATIEYAK